MMTFVSLLAARGSRLAARGASALALTLGFGVLAGSSASAQFMHESPIQATPYDVDLTPNGLIAVVRGNDGNPATQASNNRVSFWRTDVTSGAQLTPNLPLVGRGLVTTSGGTPSFSNAIALNNERAVIIGSADTDFDSQEDTTYVDIVAFDYTQSPPAVNVVSSTVLGNPSQTNFNEWAGLAHDVAITPDGLLAVVSHRNWIHVFELLTGTVVKAFNVGGPDSPGSAGLCAPGFSRNSLEVTNQHAVVTMARDVPFPGHSHTWVYVVDLSYSPPSTLPTLVLEDELLPVGNEQQKPHDLAISPDGTLAGISSFNTFGLYFLAPAPAASVFLDGDVDLLATKESLWDPTVGFCGHLWDSIEMSDTRALVSWNQPQLNQQEPPCPFDFRWRVEVFDTSSLLAQSLGQFSDDDLSPIPSFNSAWDIALSDDGGVAAVGNLYSNLALVGIDTATPSMQRFWGYGAPIGPGSPLPDLPEFTALNDTVAITKGFVTPALPPATGPGTHRWIAFQRSISLNNNPFVATLALYDLPQYLAGNPQSIEFVESHPVLDTFGADLALNRSQTEVLSRRTAPPDEANPATGGRDWSRYHAQTVPPTQTGITLGGSGIAVGVDNLVQRRGVAVSIAAHFSTPNQGFVHVVRAN